MNANEPPKPLPSDTASLPAPTFLVWAVVLPVLACAGYAGYYIVWVTFFGTSTTSGLLQAIPKLFASTAGSSYETATREVISIVSPHPASILVLLVLVAGYPFYSPYVASTFAWARLALYGQLSTNTGVLAPGEDAEGFLVSPQDNPGVTRAQITRRTLLDNLRRHLFRINLPHGIRCGTATHQGASTWEPSRKLIHGYVKRVAMMYPIPPDAEAVRASELTTRKTMRYRCEERHILKDIIDKLEGNPTISFSYRQAREFLSPLLAFYERSRIHRSRIRSRRAVDDIIGLPLGEKDPYNETEENITNALRHTPSEHDTGEETVGTTNQLPTQTNSVHALDAIASAKRGHGTPRTRGDNKMTPIAPHLLLDSQ